MSSDSRPFQVLIQGWLIADGDVEEPVPGRMIHGLAVRLTKDSYKVQRDPIEFGGVVEWVRGDSANGLVETVIAANGLRLLTSEPSASADSLPAIGAQVSVVGYLTSVGQYEFEAFGLPDVSGSWRVLAVRPASPGNDSVVADLEPLVEFRFPTASGGKAVG
ncbi:MAG: hypothetical protein ACT4QF_16295 [Sporichthyaceae bacterium]